MIQTKLPISLAELKRLTLPKPEESKHWKGIAHHQLLLTLQEQAKAQNLPLSNLRIHVNGQRQGPKTIMVASYDIDLPIAKATPNSVFSVGLVNANDQQARLTFYGGVRLLDGDVGITLGRFPLSKHSDRLNLEHEVEAGLEKVQVEAPNFKGIVEQLKRIELSDRQAREILWEVGMHPRISEPTPIDLMSWSRIGQVGKAYKEMNRQSAWALLVCFARVTNLDSPLSQMARTYRFLTNFLLKGETSLTSPKAIA